MNAKMKTTGESETPAVRMFTVGESRALLSALRALDGRQVVEAGVPLLQPYSYRVFDGSRATAYSEKDEPVPLGLRGQALLRIEQCVRAACPRHVLLRFG